MSVRLAESTSGESRDRSVELKKITAIIRSEQLEGLENRLKGSGIPGITVDQVRGYGEYAEVFARDWMSRYARIEIVAAARQVQRIVDVIVEAVHTGMEGDGIVYVLPVEEVHRIRDRHTVKSGRTQCPRCRARLRLRGRKRRATSSSRKVR